MEHTTNDQFWAKALLLQHEGDLSELDRQSSQLLRQFQADHRATPAWRLDDDVISNILYNVLQSMVDTTRGGTSDQERNAHKHVVSCICACASNGSGDPAMGRMAHLATTWITCVYWMLWDYASIRKFHTISSQGAKMVLKRDKRRCSITGKYCSTLDRPCEDSVVAYVVAAAIIKPHIAECRDAGVEDRTFAIRCMQQLSGISVDEFEDILGALDQPSNAITVAALSAESTFQEYAWGLLETDIKDHYRIENFSDSSVTYHPPLRHVDFRSRGVAAPDVRLLRFHAMVGRVIQRSGLRRVFYRAAGYVETWSVPATVSPQQFYQVATSGPSVLRCVDPSSDSDDDDDEEDDDDDM